MHVFPQMLVDSPSPGTVSFHFNSQVKHNDIGAGGVSFDSMEDLLVYEHQLK